VTVEDDMELPLAEPSSMAGDSGQPALVANAVSICRVLFFGAATMRGVARLALNSGAIFHVAACGSRLADLRTLSRYSFED
jgi:hypothetical protein